MLLSQLLQSIVKKSVLQFQEQDIVAITADSRQVSPGTLFIAIRGYTVDGHRFVAEAVAAGAVAVLVEEEIPNVNIVQVVVPDTRLASAILADVFYGHPSTKLKMIGVTGTNGKTTVTYLIEHILRAAGHITGVYGTISKRIAGQVSEVANTTPEAVELQASLHEMTEAKCDYGIIEVSSHALDLKRVAGTHFHVAVFTNLSQDHLDFHENMDNYLAAKGKLFSRLGNRYGDDRHTMSYGVLNADAPESAYLAMQTVFECVTYGIESDADVRATNIQVNPNGAIFDVHCFTGEAATILLPLTGRFNVYNALAAISVGLVEGISLVAIAKALEEMPGVPGRMERVDEQQDYTVLVDFSHTPDSLDNALRTVQQFASGRIITVVGCGGDRDKTKRPLMAQVAVRYSDLTVLTSDNPRTEDPERIIDDMEAGLQEGDAYERITDRKTAISHAIALAQPDDVILIAGKGHETYQIIGKTKHHFDDREVAREAICSRP